MQKSNHFFNAYLWPITWIQPLVQLMKQAKWGVFAMSHGSLTHFCVSAPWTAPRHEKRTPKRFVTGDWGSSHTVQPHGPDSSCWVHGAHQKLNSILFLFSEIVQRFDFNNHLRKSGSYLERPSVCSTVNDFLKIPLKLEKMKHLGRYERGRICLLFFVLVFRSRPSIWNVAELEEARGHLYVTQIVHFLCNCIH